MSKFTYSYCAKRKNFGQQPRFCSVQEHLIDSIPPDPHMHKMYMLRNPLYEAVQVGECQSECYVNTYRAPMTESGMNHIEGGWPKDVNCEDEEQVARYRRRYERDDHYVNAILQKFPKFQKLINQNNTIEMYDFFFKGLPPRASVEKIKVKRKCAFKDVNNKPVASMDWTSEDNPKLTATFCRKSYPTSQQTKVKEKYSLGYMWDIEYPDEPYLTFEPPTSCWEIVCPLEKPSLLIGGLDTGRLCLFDIRESKIPVAYTSEFHSHRAPVSVVNFMQTRSLNDFFSGSTDGKCLFWDLRNISLPIEEIIMLTRAPLRHEEPSLANAQGVTSLDFNTALPTKFLGGTDGGYFININRKGKSLNDLYAGCTLAHTGVVKTVQRNPSVIKLLLTCGDWSTHVWTDDIHSSPIITGTRYLYRTNHAVWIPQRCSSYVTVSDDGIFRYYDILRKYFAPCYTMKLSKHPLLNIKPNKVGNILATGDAAGQIFCLSISESMTLSGPEDKVNLQLLVDRERQREHILETRLKEIQLKLSTPPKPEEKPTFNEKELLKKTTIEYKKETLALKNAYMHSMKQTKTK